MFLKTGSESFPHDCLTLNICRLFVQFAANPIKNTAWCNTNGPVLDRTQWWALRQASGDPEATSRACGLTRWVSK